MEDALAKILDEARRGELIFPTNLAGAVRLQQALNDPDCHLEDAAEMVVAEPLVAARLVAIAHSVAFTRFGGRISNVRAALSLLGFNALKSLVAAIVVRQFSGAARGERASAMSAQLWRHSAHVAALARVIASRVARQDPDTAVFAGVVHEIAGFYLLSRSKDFPVLVESSAAIDTDGYQHLTQAVLGALKVPKAVAEAVAVHVPARAIVPTSVGETLAIANAMSPAASPFAHLQPGLHVDTAIDFPAADSTLQTLVAEAAEDTAAFAAELIG